MLRRMLGVTMRDRLRNKEARERTGVQENTVKVVKRSKMRWYGHVVSGEEGREGCSERSNGLPSDGEKKQEGSQRDGVYFSFVQTCPFHDTS